MLAYLLTCVINSFHKFLVHWLWYLDFWFWNFDWYLGGRIQTHNFSVIIRCTKQNKRYGWEEPCLNCGIYTKKTKRKENKDVVSVRERREIKPSHIANLILEIIHTVNVTWYYMILKNIGFVIWITPSSEKLSTLDRPVVSLSIVGNLIP